MTTEDEAIVLRSFYSSPSPDIGKIACTEQDGDGDGKIAVVHLDPAGRMFLHEAVRARELLAAAFEAVKILDPDGAVIVRASNQEIYLLEEILPDRELAEPGLVTPPAVTSPDLVTPSDARQKHDPASCQRCGDDESLELHLNPGGGGEMRCTDSRACAGRQAELARKVSARVRPYDVAAGVDPLAIPANRIGDDR
jgi:hypothetical protein